MASMAFIIYHGILFSKTSLWFVTYNIYNTPGLLSG